MQELHDRSTQVAVIGHDHDFSSASPPQPAEVLNETLDEQIEEDQSGTDKVR